MWLDRSGTWSLLVALTIATLVESGYPNGGSGEHEAFRCVEEGFHADPVDRMVFYRCVNFGNGSPLVKYRFVCGPGTVFSQADGNVCVHGPSCGQKVCDGTNDGSDNKINDIDTNNALPGTEKEKPGVQGKPESRPPSSSPSPPPPSPTCPRCDSSKVPASTGTTVAVTPSSVADSQTTAQVPARTPVFGTECKCPGFMADPQDCYKFYQCVDDGNGSFRRYDFTCSPGTIWDPKIDTCNHPWAADRAGCRGSSATNPPKPTGAPPGSPSAGATASSPSAGSAAGSPSAGSTTGSVDPTEETASTVGSVTGIESATRPPSHSAGGPQCTCAGFMEDPKDCTKFYRCVDDGTGSYKREEFTCADGSFWDRHAGSCDYPADGKPPAGCEAPAGSAAQSSPAPQPEGTAPTQPPHSSSGGPQCTCDGFMEDPEDCAKFYRCVEDGKGSFRREEFTCGEGTVWDPNAVTCNYPWAANRVGCKVPTDAQPPTSTASEPEGTTVTQSPKPSAAGPPCTCEGFMEDPHDCKKFYRCVDVGTGFYQRHEFECGPDTVWDQNILTCNHPWAADRPECGGTGNQHPSNGTPAPSEPTVTASSPETSPTQAPTDHGSSAASPSEGSSASPPAGESSAAPPPSGSSAAPPSSGSSAAPPSSGSSAAPPSGGSSAAPPSGGSSAAPPSEGSSAAPPSGGSSPVPPPGESSAIPPCDSSTHAPPSGGSSSEPPSGSPSATPPSGSSSAAPPSSSSSEVPPSGGSSAVSPSDGASGAPPSGDASAVPPSGSSSATPPSSSSSTVPPCHGSNEVAGDSSCSKEPACGEHPNERCSVCKDEGFFPNEKDCTKFYRCVSRGENNYWAYEFSCGPGTAWDQSLLTCNYRNQVASCNSGGSNGESTTGKPAKITTAPASSSESTASSSSSSSSSESTTGSSSESESSTEPCDGATTDHSVTESKEPVTDASANSTPDFGSTAGSEATTGESAATSTEASQATSVAEEQSTMTGSASTETETMPTSTNHPDSDQSTTGQGEEGTTTDSGEASTSGSHEATTEAEQSSTETSAATTSTEGCASEGATTPSSAPCDQTPPAAAVTCPIGNLTGDQIVLVCPTGFRRHPKYCNIFYQCTNDSPMDIKIVTFACPDNTIFDEKKIQCLPENECSQPCGGAKAGARVYRRVDQSESSMVHVEQRETLCPGEGHHPYNNEDCSNVFYKCKNDSSEELRGYMYECPEGFVFSQVSRRCERLSSLPLCTVKYDFVENSASPIKSKLQLPTEVSNALPRKLANY